MGATMLPEMRFHPEKGLNVNFSHEWLQGLMGGGQQQMPGQPVQMSGMQQPHQGNMIPPIIRKRF